MELLDHEAEAARQPDANPTAETSTETTVIATEETVREEDRPQPATVEQLIGRLKEIAAMAIICVMKRVLLPKLPPKAKKLPKHLPKLLKPPLKAKPHRRPMP